MILNKKILVKYFRIILYTLMAVIFVYGSLYVLKHIFFLCSNDTITANNNFHHML